MEKDLKIAEAPRGLAILAMVGPAFVWCAEYIGSGEVILATRTGAILGYSVLWAVVIGIVLKACIGLGGARYTVCTGEGMIDMFSRIPGKKNWAVWVVLLCMFLVGAMAIGSLVSAASVFAHSLIPLSPIIWGWIITLFAIAVVWSGTFDVIKYIMSVFMCFGFRLPRNSSKLIQASPCVIPLEEYDRDTRLEILSSSPEGITIIGYPGHVMIYLGSMNGTSYIIHLRWAWRSPVNVDTDITHRLARVTVSDLLLGEGSKKGALIDRVTQIAIFGNYILEAR